MTQNKILTQRQRIAAKAIAAGETIAAVAVMANVGRKTIYRWLDQPDFTKAVTMAGDEAVADLTRRLVGISMLALDQLETILTDPDAQPNVKCRAAEIILARLLPLREMTEIDARLSALEGGTK